MPSIAIGQAALKRLDLEMGLVNMLYERQPINQEDQVSIIQRGGTELFLSQGDQPVRGLFCQPGTFGGDYVVVMGTKAYRVTVGDSASLLGTVAGTRLVVMAGNASTVLIATGGTLYSTNGTTISTVAFPDSANVVWVAYINGYFIAVRGGSHRYYFSALGVATFDALDFLSAENSPDELYAAVVTGDEVWMIGAGSIEVHVPTGDADAPFQRINGRLFGIGCSNPDGIAVVGDAICWPGADKLIYRTSQGAPTAISDNGLEERLQVADLSTLKGWAYKLEGHEYYVLNIDDETHAFDTSAGFWHQMTSYGRAGFRGHCSPFGQNPNALPLVGDSLTGKVWKFSAALSTDDGQPMAREFMGMVTVPGRTPCDKVHLDCTAGRGKATYPGDDPLIQMRMSDDRGQTWSSWRTAKLGRQGRYTNEPVWKQNGAMNRPGRQFHWRVSEDVHFSVRRAKFNEWRA